MRKDFDMLKFSYTTMGTPDLDAYQAIDAAVEYGFQGVDLRVHSHKGELQLNSTEEEIDGIKAYAVKNNIAFPSLLCYNKVGEVGENESWSEMKDDILSHLKLAKKLNAESIRIFGGAPKVEEDYEQYLENFIATLQEVIDSDSSSINIILQNHGGSFNFLQGVSLTQSISRDRFGMCFSPDHCVMMDENWNDVLIAVPKYSKHMYFSDVKKYDEGYKGILPGQGDVDLKIATHAIKDSDFNGWISFKWEKIWQDHLPEYKVAFPEFFKLIKSII